MIAAFVAAHWPDAAALAGGAVVLFLFASLLVGGFRWLWLKAFPRRRARTGFSSGPAFARRRPFSSIGDR